MNYSFISIVKLGKNSKNLIKTEIEKNRSKTIVQKQEIKIKTRKHNLN